MLGVSGSSRVEEPELCDELQVRGDKFVVTLPVTGDGAITLPLAIIRRAASAFGPLNQPHSGGSPESAPEILQGRRSVQSTTVSCMQTHGCSSHMIWDPLRTNVFAVTGRTCNNAIRLTQLQLPWAPAAHRSQRSYALATRPVAGPLTYNHDFVEDVRLIEERL
jgi:hypothetical protein